MTHRGPFQPLPFCDSVIQPLLGSSIPAREELWCGKGKNKDLPTARAPADTMLAGSQEEWGL